MQLKILSRKFKNFLYSLFKYWKRSLLFILIFLLIILSTPFLLKFLFTQSYSDKIFTDINEVPVVHVGLVFGAGLDEKARPSNILEDRILTAVELYKQGKIEKIIMSGDNRALDYDEPSAMIDFAVENGVTPEDLQPDYAGLRTYDSCVRARDIFSLSEITIITQSFHMSRAMYTCSSLGITTYGVIADKREYEDELSLDVRDTYAFMLAVWDVNIRKPSVVLGDKIDL